MLTPNTRALIREVISKYGPPITDEDIAEVEADARRKFYDTKGINIRLVDVEIKKMLLLNLTEKAWLLDLIRKDWEGS